MLIIAARPLMPRELSHEWVMSHIHDKARFCIWHPWELLFGGDSVDVPWE